MHVETMSRSPVGMFLPFDQQPSGPSNPHTFPPIPSPESECFPQWLQFDSPAASLHYGIPAFGGDGNSPAEAPQVFHFSPAVARGSAEAPGGLDGTACVDLWDEQRRPLPSFPATLGRAKRRALDLACITRATPTGLHPPYSPGDANAVSGFSPLPPSSGCYGHLSANDYCWGEQVNDNQVVVSQNEGLCMLVDSQESYSRNDDYSTADANMVVMDLYVDNHVQQQQTPSFIESYSLPCGMGGEEVKMEEHCGVEYCKSGSAAGRHCEERLGVLSTSDAWGESDAEDEEEEGAEDEEEEEEEVVEELRQSVEEEVAVEEEGKRRRRGGWKRGRRTRRRNRRKQQANDSDEDESNVADDVFLPGDDDGECSLPNIPTTLVCRWSDCNAIFGDQTALVKHIEKNHVDARSRGGGGSGGSTGRGCSGSQSSGGSLGEEFTCFWHLCPRRTRPFNARYKLLIHMRVHSGDKPNKCPYEGCPKAFSRLENLKIHQRSHTGERPYTCQFPLCPKAFSNSSDRAKHQRTHFDTKPYACQVAGCSKRYTDPSSLRKHVKNHSPKDQTQARRKAKSVDSTSSLRQQNKESKCPPSTPPSLPHATSAMYQDCSSEISSSSASAKGAFGIQELALEDENTAENHSTHNQESVDDDYSNGDLIAYSSQEVEDDLFFDCFQSLESIKPLLNTEKESASSSDLPSSTQFELSLDLDCGDVQQDFLEIGVLEKWGVTGSSMVECCATDDALDGDFLTIS